MTDGDKFVAGLTAVIAQGTFWGVLSAFAVRGVIRWVLSAFQITAKRRD